MNTPFFKTYNLLPTLNSDKKILAKLLIKLDELPKNQVLYITNQERTFLSKQIHISPITKNQSSATKITALN